MLFLGLLLLTATAAFTGLAISDNLGGGPDYTVSVLGNDIATMSPVAIFCAGLALALIFSLGLWMTTAGAMLRRSRRIRMRHERDALAARLSERETTTAPQASEPADAPVPRRHRGRRIHLFGH